MKARDVVGKRIVAIKNVRVKPDGEYYGPRVACTRILLEDGTRIVAIPYESSDQPVSDMYAIRRNIHAKTKA